jgi:hypothetical protein
MGYGFSVSSDHESGKAEEIAYSTEGQKEAQTSSVASIYARSDFGYPWIETVSERFGLDEWDSREEETRETDL